MKNIEGILEKIVLELRDKFKNLAAIILYGSWAKGKAREDSDIDILVVFDKINDDTRKALYEIERASNSEGKHSFVPCSKEDFRQEKNPLFTAVKREGRILWGDIDFTINSQPPQVKYADYFKKSREVETKKIEIAQEILKEHPDYGSGVFCFVASKHAIQMALAMKGLGYSSKITVLLPLVEEYISEDVAIKFKTLFSLYVRSEYNMEFLTKEESKQALEIAKEILSICYDNEREKIEKTK